MKKIYVPMIRFGDREFDEGYIGWGFNSYEDQMRDAQAVLTLVGRRNIKILDLACGLGIYHKLWLENGHTVVGSDLSETFIFMANNTNGSYPNASYRVENYYDLSDQDEYDLVTLMDTPIEDAELPTRVFRALKPGGEFLFQIANPAYPHPRGQVGVNRRDWKEMEDHSLLLTRHEYNADIDRWEYEEWHVDIERAEIVVEHSFSHILTFAQTVDVLRQAGFSRIGFYGPDGAPYAEGNTEHRNYFALAYKSQ